MIRNATIDDLPRIVAIYNASIPARMATADLEPASVESRKTWFERHKNLDYPLWVFEDADRIVAWLGALPFKDRIAYQGAVEVSIYIDPPAQGRGIGSTLLKKLIDEAAGCGIHSLISVTFSHNEASLALHRKFNFEHWGTLPEVCDMDGVMRSVEIWGRKLTTDEHR